MPVSDAAALIAAPEARPARRAAPDASMPPATTVPPAAAVVATAAPAPSCGAPVISPAAMPGTKMARPNTAMAARMVEAACVSVMSAVGRTSVPKIELPMPTTMASTISLMAGRDDVAEHALGQEGGLAEQRERHQHETGQAWSA